MMADNQLPSLAFYPAEGQRPRTSAEKRLQVRSSSGQPALHTCCESRGECGQHTELCAVGYVPHACQTSCQPAELSTRAQNACSKVPETHALCLPPDLQEELELEAADGLTVGALHGAAVGAQVRARLHSAGLGGGARLSSPLQ